MKLITAMLLSLSLVPSVHSEEQQSDTQQPETLQSITPVEIKADKETSTSWLFGLIGGDETEQTAATTKETAAVTAKQIKAEPEQTAATAKETATVITKQAKAKQAQTVAAVKETSIVIAKLGKAKVEKNSNESNTAAIQAPTTLAPLPENIEGKPSRFAYIRKLIDTSSGARQVKASENTDAQRHYRMSRQHYADAATTADTKEVNQLLDKTVKEMYKAIRLASPKELINRKKKHDFDRRLKSVEALQTAFNRVANEKNKTQEAKQLNDNVGELKAQAQSFYQNNKFDSAREQLDSAYLLIKSSISNLRSGDTLVRELSFASKEEEYHYEIDRNETHKMLLKLLVAKKLSSRPESFKQRINKRVETAKTIRGEAEAYALDGDYEEAVNSLERSTKELVRAIRMGGVFIPG